MKIERLKHRDDAPIGAPLLEVRRAGEAYVASIELSLKDSLLTGPFPTAASAEESALNRAKAGNVETIYMVTLDA